MKKYAVFLAMLFAVALTLGCAQQKMNAKDIVNRMEEKYESVKNYRADVFYQVKIGAKSMMNTTMNYVYEKPDKVYLNNRKLGEIIVSNGKTIWLYNGRDNTLRVMNFSDLNSKDRKSFEKGMLKTIIDDTAKSNVTYLGTDTFEGRKCYVVKLNPENQTGVTIKVWIDSGYWLPVKVCSSSKTLFGSMVTTIEFRNLSVNTNVNDSMFNFTPPEGARIEKGAGNAPNIYKNVSDAQKHVNFTIISPRYTANLKLKEVIVLNSTGTVVLEYTNGTCTMSVIESAGKMVENPHAKNVTINGRKVEEYRSITGGYVFSFTENGVNIRVVSPCLSRSELIKVVGSM